MKLSYDVYIEDVVVHRVVVGGFILSICFSVKGWSSTPGWVLVVGSSTN